MNKDTIFEYLISNDIEYYENYDIKSFLTIGIGGKVRGILIVKKKKDLENLIIILEKENTKYIVIGGGSNVLFSDNTPELFVIINRTNVIEIKGHSEISVASGVPNKFVLDWCKNNGFCGLAFLAGIPGTIGGAAAVNAGAFGKSMSGVIKEAEVYFSKKGVLVIGLDRFDFQYRNSAFKYGNNTILSLSLIVKKCSNDEVASRISEILKKRGTKHPSYQAKTAGCFFKNPIINGNKVSAGKLIEESGLKGKVFPNIKISDLHSNFIINTNNANFNDIQNVEKIVIEQTQKKTGIKLEREVIYILPDGKKV